MKMIDIFSYGTFSLLLNYFLKFIWIRLFHRCLVNSYLIYKRNSLNCVIINSFIDDDYGIRIDWKQKNRKTRKSKFACDLSNYY